MRQHYIYKLICPTTNKIRYIGQTTDPANRVKGHISKAKKYAHIENSKHKWVLDLLSRDSRPILEVIEIANESNFAEKESGWIDFYSNEDLFNKTSGGESNSFKSGNIPWNHSSTGNSFSEESRQKMSESHSGKILSDDHRANISSKMKGKRLSDQCYKAVSEKTIIPVLRYDLEGNFIDEFKSVSSAAEAHNTSTSIISRCCRGKSRACKGFVFRYKSENYLLKIDPKIPDRTIKRMKSIHI